MKLNEMLDMLGNSGDLRGITEDRVRRGPDGKRLESDPRNKSKARSKSRKLNPDWIRTKNTFPDGNQFPAYFTKYAPKSDEDHEYYKYIDNKGKSRFSRIPLNIAQSGRKRQSINNKDQDSVLGSMSVIMRDAMGLRNGYAKELTNTDGGTVSREIFAEVNRIFEEYTTKVRSKKYTKKNNTIPLFDWQNLKRVIEGILMSDDISQSIISKNTENDVDYQIPYNIKSTGHGKDAPTLASFIAHKAVLALQDTFGLRIGTDGVIPVYGDLQTYLQAAGVENGMYSNIETIKAEQDAVMNNGNTAHHNSDVGARNWSTTD